VASLSALPHLLACHITAVGGLARRACTNLTIFVITVNHRSLLLDQQFAPRARLLIGNAEISVGVNSSCWLCDRDALFCQCQLFAFLILVLCYGFSWFSFLIKVLLKYIRFPD